MWSAAVPRFRPVVWGYLCVRCDAGRIRLQMAGALMVRGSACVGRRRRFPGRWCGGRGAERLLCVGVSKLECAVGPHRAHRRRRPPAPGRLPAPGLLPAPRRPRACGRRRAAESWRRPWRRTSAQQLVGGVAARDQLGSLWSRQQDLEFAVCGR